MKVIEKLTEAEFAERLDEVLDRARQGDEFVIEREGEPIALIRPPDPGVRPSITWGEFLAKYWALP